MTTPLQDVERLNAQLAGASTVDVLHWTNETFGAQASFGTGFGVEGCVLIHLIATEELSIDLFSLDTGLFFDETYSLWEQLERRYGIKIRAVTSELTLSAQAERYGPELWANNPDECCRLRKVVPLAQALAGRQAWLSAIRAEQTSERASTRTVEWHERFGLLKISPLLGWSDEQIWSFVREHDVPFNPMHQRGFPSIGCFPCTSPIQPGEGPRAGRWRGRNKTECGLHGRFITPDAAVDPTRGGK